MAVYQEPQWLQTYLQSQANPAQRFQEQYLAPIEKAGVSIATTYKNEELKSKIDEIIADETKKAEVRKGMTPVETDEQGNLIPISGPAKGELDYKSLERRLLPYDKELSAKYGVMAERQATIEEGNALKREQFNAAAKVKSDAELAKKQALTNKFDLSTEEGKLAWKNQFNKVQTAMWQPGFATADATTVQEPVKAQLNNLIDQAQAYPELLASVGIKGKKIPTTETPSTSAVETSAIDATVPLEANHAQVLAIDINRLAKVDKYGVLNSPELIDLVNQYASKNLIKMDKKLRDEVVANAKELIEQKKQQAAEIKQQQIAANARAKEDAKYQASMNQDAYKALNSSPEYTSYKATNDAIASYEASSKDLNAKRKLVYDYIKSYNTGTVLDSELNSTIGGSSIGAGLVTAIKNKVGLESLNTLTDEQVAPIADNMKRGLTVLKTNLDKKAKGLEKVYGAKGLTETKQIVNEKSPNYKIKQMLGTWYESMDGGKTWSKK